MDSLSAWWGSLESLAQWFYAGAVFFSVLFVWQLVAALIGLSAGDHDLDAGAHVDASGGHDLHTHDGDHHESMAVFKLLSLRSVLAFATLFAWAGALYLNTGVAAGWAMFYATLWGLLALVLVAFMLNLLPRLAQSGNLDMASAIQAMAPVYLDIPKDGDGEIRVLVSGVMTHLRARTADGAALKAGATIKVLRVLGPNLVEVEPTTVVVVPERSLKP